MLSALRWTDPERDTAFVRALAERRLRRGEAIRCVWSGRRLAPDALDIDHCLPFPAWACNDLWNLLPAHRALNQRAKRERLVAAATLAAAKQAILAWWDEACLHADEAMRQRFAEEARTSLPIAKDRAPDLEDVFAGVDFRRLRLRQEADLREWAGTRGTG